MSKSYPLEPKTLVEVESGGHVLGWYSKGHHAPGPFIAACLRALNDEAYDEEIQQAKPERVQHEHWRNTPYGDGWMIYYPAQGGTPGAYPVTVVRF